MIDVDYETNLSVVSLREASEAFTVFLANGTPISMRPQTLIVPPWLKRKLDFMEKNHAALQVYAEKDRNKLRYRSVFYRPVPRRYKLTNPIFNHSIQRPIFKEASS